MTFQTRKHQIEKNKQLFDPEHEAKYRRLSVREVARIQTYPDDFIFYYKSVLDGYKMVGNSVPVQLAYVLGNSIINQFDLYNKGEFKHLLKTEGNQFELI